jgi:hypothetical protein
MFLGGGAIHPLLRQVKKAVAFLKKSSAKNVTPLDHGAQNAGR